MKTQMEFGIKSLLLVVPTLLVLLIFTSVSLIFASIVKYLQKQEGNYYRHKVHTLKRVDGLNSLKFWHGIRTIILGILLLPIVLSDRLCKWYFTYLQGFIEKYKSSSQPHSI